MKNRILVLFCLAFLLVGYSQASTLVMEKNKENKMTNNFVVDLLHSSVDFSVKHMMVSNVKGSFKEFTADLSYDIKTDKFESLSAIIEAKSIETRENKRDAHLRSADFFDVEVFPKMTFKMTSYKVINKKEGELTGDITIKGITKQITLKSEINGVLQNGNMIYLGFTLDGKLNRKDFGLNWNKAIEAGGVLVGDEIKISVDIEASSKL